MPHHKVASISIRSHCAAADYVVFYRSADQRNVDGEGSMQRRGCGNRIMVGQRDLRGRFIAQFRFWYAADVPGIENEFACPTLRRKRTIATYEYIWPSPMASNAFL